MPSPRSSRPWEVGWRWLCCISVAVLMILAVVGGASAADAGARSRQGTVEDPYQTYLALLQKSSPLLACPTTSERQYDRLGVLPPPSDRPARIHADLNLGLRGYVRVGEYSGLVSYDGATDADAPQLAGLLATPSPDMLSSYRVYDWDWSCGADGCPGEPLDTYPVTLLGLASTPGRPVGAPNRGQAIDAGGHVALVLYAEERRITLKYTREDNVLSGYTVHLENICVDPALLKQYQALDQAGRSQLPALRRGEILGYAAGDEIRVAVRDCGTFMDPRSQKDWWQH